MKFKRQIFLALGVLQLFALATLTGSGCSSDKDSGYTGGGGYPPFTPGNTPGPGTPPLQLLQEKEPIIRPDTKKTIGHIWGELANQSFSSIVLLHIEFNSDAVPGGSGSGLVPLNELVDSSGGVPVNGSVRSDYLTAYNAVKFLILNIVGKKVGHYHDHMKGNKNYSLRKQGSKFASNYRIRSLSSVNPEFVQKRHEVVGNLNLSNADLYLNFEGKDTGGALAAVCAFDFAANEAAGIRDRISLKMQNPTSLFDEMGLNTFTTSISKVISKDIPGSRSVLAISNHAGQPVSPDHLSAGARSIVSGQKLELDL